MKPVPIFRKHIQRTPCTARHCLAGTQKPIQVPPCRDHPTPTTACSRWLEAHAGREQHAKLKELWYERGHYSSRDRMWELLKAEAREDGELEERSYAGSRDVVGLAVPRLRSLTIVDQGCVLSPWSIEATGRLGDWATETALQFCMLLRIHWT